MITSKELIKHVEQEKIFWDVHRDDYENWQYTLIKIIQHHKNCEYCRNSFDSSEWRNYLDFTNYVKVTPTLFIHTCSDEE